MIASARLWVHCLLFPSTSAAVREGNKTCLTSVTTVNAANAFGPRGQEAHATLVRSAGDGEFLSNWETRSMRLTRLSSATIVPAALVSGFHDLFMRVICGQRKVS